MSRVLMLFAFVLLALTATPGLAQGKFSPELQVGDRVVTRYQIDQRARLLGLLGAPGDTRTLAREQLINEAVQLSAAAEAEIEVSPEALEAGITEFATRANLTSEQLIQILGQAGIGRETFRDFIGAGVAWREVVQSRFADSARASLPESLVTRTLAKTGTDGGTRVLVSEILLPATNPETAQASRSRAAEISALQGEEAFAAAARRYSVANSRNVGGELNWTDLNSLPEEVRGVIGTLAPGQISRPIEIENAVAIFLLRDLELVQAGTEQTILVDYALFRPEPGQAAAVIDRIDTCEDLYGVAQGLPEDRLTRATTAQPALPGELRAALDALDENEASVISRGGAASVLMLCERKPSGESTVDRDIIGNRLVNLRLTSTAVHYLTELRAGTTVIDLTN
ncbi:MAG: peptidylprolyl isomerase [Silicimonas sp.]|nr:peptidylprolyl isomerase [Silicimonas sp.]